GLRPVPCGLLGHRSCRDLRDQPLGWRYASMGMTLVDGIKGKSLRMRPDPESIEAIREGDTLRFGLLPLDVRWSPERPDVIRLRSLAGKLLIPGEWRVHVRSEDGEVMMGPVIGIFTSSRRPGRSEERRVGKEWGCRW